MFKLVMNGKPKLLDSCETVAEAVFRLLMLWREETDPTITYSIKDGDDGKVVATISCSPGGYAVITYLIPKVRFEVYNVQLKNKTVLQYECAETKGIKMPKRLSADSPIWDEEKHEPSIFGSDRQGNG